MMTDPVCANCRHPKKSHRYGGANKHGPYTYLSNCRKEGCGCRGYEHPEKGVTRRD